MKKAISQDDKFYDDLYMKGVVPPQSPLSMLRFYWCFAETIFECNKYSPLLTARALLT